MRWISTAMGGAGLVVAAVGLWFATTPRSASFGWTAYSPLAAEAYVVPVGPPWWALALLALGCAAIGAAITALILRKHA